jgi:hypothetical protein
MREREAASMSPAGPAPMMRMSHSEVVVVVVVVVDGMMLEGEGGLLLWSDGKREVGRLEIETVRDVSRVDV